MSVTFLTWAAIHSMQSTCCTLVPFHLFWRRGFAGLITLVDGKTGIGKKQLDKSQRSCSLEVARGRTEPNTSRVFPMLLSLCGPVPCYDDFLNVHLPFAFAFHFIWCIFFLCIWIAYPYNLCTGRVNWLTDSLIHPPFIELLTCKNPWVSWSSGSQGWIRCP